MWWDSVLNPRWIALGSAAAAALAFVRGRSLRWGATDEETRVALPVTVCPQFPPGMSRDRTIFTVKVLARLDLILVSVDREAVSGLRGFAGQRRGSGLVLVRVRLRRRCA
jgi:hypothetical protein